MTAGTVNLAVAEEAVMIAEQTGCDTLLDAGVAGIPRIIEPLRRMIVVAGREGTSPTVVAGLVDVPLAAMQVFRLLELFLDG